jgi:hypothetical protein
MISVDYDFGTHLTFLHVKKYQCSGARGCVMIEEATDSPTTDVIKETDYSLHGATVLRGRKNFYITYCI